MFREREGVPEQETENRNDRFFVTYRIDDSQPTREYRINGRPASQTAGQHKIVASELKDHICHSNECQIGSFSSQAAKSTSGQRLVLAEFPVPDNVPSQLKNWNRM